MASKLALAASALFLSSVLAAAPAKAENASNAASARVTAPTYVAKAGAGDLYEIESSRLAMEKARDSRVKEFARMMIDHHQTTTQKVAAAAREAKLNPQPPKLDAAQSAMLADLRSATAANFDSLYLTQQRKAHEQALMLHSGYAANGESAPLKKVANEAVPIIKRHQAALTSL